MILNRHHAIVAKLILVNVTTSLVPGGLAIRLCYYWTPVNIDIRVADSVSAPPMSSYDSRLRTVQPLCEPSGSSAVTVPSLK